MLFEEGGKFFEYFELENKTMLELYQIAKANGMTGYSKLRKKELIFEITKALTHSDELLQAKGVWK